MRTRSEIKEIVEDSNIKIYNALAELTKSFSGKKMSTEDLLISLSKSISFIAANAASDVASEIIRLMDSDEEVRKTETYRMSRAHLHSVIMVLADLYKLMDEKQLDCVKKVRVKFT